MNAYDVNSKAISSLAQGPVVDGILLTRSRDIPQIENTLDGLLDFCGDQPVNGHAVRVGLPGLVTE